MRRDGRRARGDLPDGPFPGVVVFQHIFGVDGGRKMAEQYGMEWLGALPLSMDIRLQADSGKPTVAAAPDSEAARLYGEIARKVAVKVAMKARDFSAKFPTITISKDT